MQKELYVAFWHKCEVLRCPNFRRFRGMSGNNATSRNRREWPECDLHASRLLRRKLTIKPRFAARIFLL
jgi:hypothetical protein